MASLAAPVTSLALVTVFTTCAIVLGGRIEPGGTDLQLTSTVRMVVVDMIAQRPLSRAFVRVDGKIFGPTGSNGRCSLLLPPGYQTFADNLTTMKEYPLRAPLLVQTWAQRYNMNN